MHGHGKRFRHVVTSIVFLIIVMMMIVIIITIMCGCKNRFADIDSVRRSERDLARFEAPHLSHLPHLRNQQTTACIHAKAHHRNDDANHGFSRCGRCKRLCVQAMLDPGMR